MYHVTDFVSIVSAGRYAYPNLCQRSCISLHEVTSESAFTTWKDEVI
jgi:hypothetical protein